MEKNKYIQCRVLDVYSHCLAKNVQTQTAQKLSNEKEEIRTQRK